MQKNDYYNKLEFMHLFCKALGNPTRLKIAFGLLDKEYCNVTTMVKNLNISQPGVSQHLTILKNAGIIKVMPKDNTRCYSIKNKKIHTLISQLKEFENEK